MITCQELIAFIHDYLSGELPAPELTRFREHLGVCPWCVAYLQNYERSIELGRDALRDGGDAIPPEVPDELVRAVLAARRAGSG